jgi:hypothetical protein
MKGFKGMKLVITFVVIAMFLVTSLLMANKVIKAIEARIVRNKVARSATATVIRKEYIQFDEKNPVYVDENGISIKRHAGDEEWRVYYNINTFDDIEQLIANKLIKAEEERNAKGKQRFRILTKDQYDYIQVGDKLSVTWCRPDGSEIEIISAGKPVTTYSR